MERRISELDIAKIAGGKEIPDDVLRDFNRFKNDFQNGKYEVVNFLKRLPGGHLRRLLAQGHLEDSANAVGANVGPNASELRRSQSLVEFLNTVEVAVRDLGLYGELENLWKESDKINKERKSIMSGPDEEAKTAIRLANEEIKYKIQLAVGWPTYWRLRVMGYNHYPDLMS